MASLFAKSKYGQLPQKTLREHTLDVLAAARALFGTNRHPTRRCGCWLRFFRLNAGSRASFLNALEAACLLHDLGKANGDFQAAVTGHQNGQYLRHEHVSALLLNSLSIRKWLEQREDVDWDVVLSAVYCHHLKADLLNLIPTFAYRRHQSLQMLNEHPEFVSLLTDIGERLHLKGELPSGPAGWRSGRVTSAPWESLEKSRNSLADRLNDFGDGLQNTGGQSRLLLAVRAALIAADAAGSGLPRTDQDISGWIESVLPSDNRNLCDREYIRSSIINPRIEELQTGRRWQGWSDFQDHAANLPQRSLLLAPCGSGKTLAAWRWIEQQAGEGVGHCLFLYPTRATATEGFRDYVAWAPEADAALMHGTAAYELDGMFSNSNEEEHRKDRHYETEQRLFALGYWPKLVFSATVDQFLSFLQYGYSSICLLPVLVDSVVVVDEIHSFDDSMFQTLLDFLQHFDVPVLCMTATLSQERRRKLEQQGGMNLLDAGSGPFRDLQVISQAPRYTIHHTTLEDAEQHARQRLQEGRRVLWVVNTVARAQAIARRFAARIHSAELQTSDGQPVFCYHSRFRLCDRKRHHEAVIRAFRRDQNNTNGTLAVTTQVCEMGLDLDADVLIAETAPVSSLIQRMGRCNRAHQPRACAGEVLVYEPDSPRPYDEERDLIGVPEFLSDVVTGDPVSQAGLESAMRRAPQPRDQRKPVCQFLGSGPFALSGADEFRDIEEFTVPAVLASDVQDVMDCLLRKQPIDGHILPVPNWIRKLELAGPSELPRYLCVAPSQYYLPTLGFCSEAVAQGDPPPCPRTNPPLIA